MQLRLGEFTNERASVHANFVTKQSLQDRLLTFRSFRDPFRAHAHAETHVLRNRSRHVKDRAITSAAIDNEIQLTATFARSSRRFSAPDAID